MQGRQPQLVAQSPHVLRQCGMAGVPLEFRQFAKRRTRPAKTDSGSSDVYILLSVTSYLET